MIDPYHLLVTINESIQINSVMPYTFRGTLSEAGVEAYTTINEEIVEYKRLDLQSDEDLIAEAASSGGFISRVKDVLKKIGAAAKKAWDKFISILKGLWQKVVTQAQKFAAKFGKNKTVEKESKDSPKKTITAEVHTWDKQNMESSANLISTLFDDWALHINNMTDEYERIDYPHFGVPPKRPIGRKDPIGAASTDLAYDAAKARNDANKKNTNNDFENLTDIEKELNKYIENIKDRTDKMDKNLDKWYHGDSGKSDYSFPWGQVATIIKSQAVEEEYVLEDIEYYMLGSNNGSAVDPVKHEFDYAEVDQALRMRKDALGYIDRCKNDIPKVITWMEKYKGHIESLGGEFHTLDGKDTVNLPEQLRSKYMAAASGYVKSLYNFIIGISGDTIKCMTRVLPRIQQLYGACAKEMENVVNIWNNDGKTEGEDND